MGIGPIADAPVRLAGLHGGGLSLTTGDGWWVEEVTLRWPSSHLILGRDFGSVYSVDDPFWKLYDGTTLRAFGFSPTGQSLVLATSSDVRIWSRAVVGG